MNSMHLSYSRINLMLQGHRKNQNLAIVQQAHEEYSFQFDEVFGYIKNGKTVVMSSAADIAKWYKELCEVSLVA